MENEKPFGVRLRELIIDRGCTQLDLAKFVGVKPNTVSDWIRKGNSPKIKHIEKIVEYFGISFDYLFTGYNNITKKDCTYELDKYEQKIIEKYRKLPDERTRLMFYAVASDKIKDIIDEYVVDVKQEKDAV